MTGLTGLKMMFTLLIVNSFIDEPKRERVARGTCGVDSGGWLDFRLNRILVSVLCVQYIRSANMNAVRDAAATLSTSEPRSYTLSI